MAKITFDQEIVDMIVTDARNFLSYGESVGEAVCLAISENDETYSLELYDEIAGYLYGE